MQRSFALSLLSLASLVLAACRAGHIAERQPEDSGLAALVEAVGPHRLLEPRLTGGFAYGSCELIPAPDRLVAEPRCSPLPTSGTPALRALNRAAAAVELAAKRHPSPRTLHAQAILALLGQGGNRALDRAVAELEEIGASGVATIQSDLAAALLLRAERQDEPYDLVQALEAADRAVASDPRLPEARFNRALIFEKLYLAEAERSACDIFFGSIPTPAGLAKPSIGSWRSLPPPRRVPWWIPELWTKRRSGVTGRRSLDSRPACISRPASMAKTSS